MPGQPYRKIPELFSRGLCSICEEPLPIPLNKQRYLHKACREQREKEQNELHKQGKLHPEAVMVTPENRRNGNKPICGMPKDIKDNRGEKGEKCCLPAGWGTSHPGYGACRNHMGNTPNMIAAAQSEKMRDMFPFYGTSIEIDPHTALLQEVHRTAGHVAWLGQVVQFLGVERGSQADLPEEALAILGQFTSSGIKSALVFDMYDKERQNLVRVSKAAIDAGVAERQVKIAEEQSFMLAQVLQAFMYDPDLNLTPAQLTKAPELLKRHLLTLGTDAAIEVQAKELTP